MPESVNVAVMAPSLGADLSYVTDVSSRLRAVDVSDDSASSRAALEAADVLLVGYPVPPDVAARAPRLAWAHHTQAGVSNLRGSDLWTSAVTLTTSRGAVSATGIAEYVVAAAMYWARGLHDGSRQKQAGAFDRDGYEMLTVSAATMGVIGLGGIGQEVARLSRAAGMRVVATRRSVTAPLHDVDSADLLLPASQLIDVAEQSDFLAICSQLTPETHRMINADVLAAMKASAVLINIARGEEVDEDALVTAVVGGQIRGAVLDVYDGELAGRAPRRELVEHPRILLTPHISGRGDPMESKPVKQLFAKNLRRFLNGEPLTNTVDRDRGY